MNDLNFILELGWIEVITGPMFSGKTEELIKRLTNLKYAKKEFVCFKPLMDNRWSKKELVVSRAGSEIKAIPIESPEDAFDYISESTTAVAFDEAQFFDNSILDVISKLADMKKRVIVAGLELDIHREPFGQMHFIMAIAEFVTKLKAVCFVCGNSASFTYKIKGDPNQIIQVGDKEYEARCRHHFNKY